MSRQRYGCSGRQVEDGAQGEENPMSTKSSSLMRTAGRPLVLMATLLATVAGCGQEADDQGAPTPGPGASAPPTPSAKADSTDLADNLRPEEVEALHNHPRFVLRDRLDLSGNPVAERRAQTFSHRSRRWHVFPFASYGQATYTVELKTEDARMANTAAVWVFGPRLADGSWGKPAPAVAENGTVKVNLNTREYGQYALVVGPETGQGFLPRYPGHQAIVRYEDEEGFHEEERVYIVSEQGPDGAEILSLGFANAQDEIVEKRPIANPVNAPDYDPEANDGIIWAEGPDGELDWYSPEAWSRSTWFISKDGGDLRLGLFNEPYEGITTLIDPDNPGAQETFHILESVSGDGKLLSLSGDDLMDAALVALVPEVHNGEEITLTKDGSCDADPDLHNCMVPAYIKDDAIVPVENGDALITYYRPLHIDVDESSLYDLKVTCEGTCSPKSQITKYPIYLAHGFNTSRVSWTYFIDSLANDDRWQSTVFFDDAADEDQDGWKEPHGWVYADSVPGYQPVPVRAEHLRRNMTDFLARLKADNIPPAANEAYMRLNVIAHSMGGLDNRFLLNHPKYNNDQCHQVQMCAPDDAAPNSQYCCTDADGEPEACCLTDDDGVVIQWRDRVVSVTTLSTPHCGSSFASWGMRQLNRDFLNWAFRKVVKLVMGLSPEDTQALIDTFYALSVEYCEDVMSAHLEPVPERKYTWQCAQDSTCRAELGLDEADLPSTDANGQPKLPAPTRRGPTFFSWSAQSCVTGSCGDTLATELLLPFRIVRDNEGENDGVVATESSIFGIWMGTRANDHFRWTQLKPSSMGRFTRWLFGVPDEPVLDWHFYWLDTLSRSGY
ncbi:MAG: esterase/lipase family protein [Bradymonadia bacterium]